MQVGIREFKARLSHYVRVVRAGGQVVVTERGRPVAQFTSVPSHEAPLLPPVVDALIQQGRVAAPTATVAWAPVARAHAGRTSTEILDEDRGDR